MSKPVGQTLPQRYFMDERTNSIRRLNFASLVAWLTASVVMATTALLWFGEDFRGYYAAARALIEGGNPYDYHTLAPILLETTGGVGNNPYYYAPFFAWFIIPLAWIPFDIARGIWMILNLVLWNFSLWQSSNLFEYPKPGWRRWLSYLLATFIFAWITWRYEQTGIILFALLLGTLFALKRNSGIWAGLCMALLLMKPNVTLIPVIAITLWLIRHRNWQPVISMVALTISLLLLAWIITPNLFQPFFEAGFGQGLFSTLDGPDKIVSTRVNTTLQDWLTMHRVSHGIARTVSMIAFVSGLLILGVVIRKTDSLILVVISSVLINFAITPYALQYDYPLLTLVLFWDIALMQYGNRERIKRIGLAIIGFIVTVPFWERPISDGYWMLIGLIGLTVCSWYNADKSKIPASLLQVARSGGGVPPPQ